MHNPVQTVDNIVKQSPFCSSFPLFITEACFLIQVGPLFFLSRWKRLLVLPVWQDPSLRLGLWCRIGGTSGGSVTNDAAEAAERLIAPSGLSLAYIQDHGLSKPVLLIHVSGHKAVCGFRAVRECEGEEALGRQVKRKHRPVILA